MPAVKLSLTKTKKKRRQRYKYEEREKDYFQTIMLYILSYCMQSIFNWKD